VGVSILILTFSALLRRAGGAAAPMFTLEVGSNFVHKSRQKRTRPQHSVLFFRFPGLSEASSLRPENEARQKCQAYPSFVGVAGLLEAKLLVIPG